MSTVSPEQKNNERRQQVYLGPLPSDFLRIAASSQQQQEAADQQAALALQQQMAGAGATAYQPQPQHVGRLLPQRVNSIYLEIYDECSFTMDELIAWAHIPIPATTGPLQQPYSMYHTMASPFVMVPTTPMYGVQPAFAPVPVYTMPTPAVAPVSAPPAPQPQITAEEYKMIEDMFPNMDKEVIRSVFEANRGSKEGTINCLLQMNE
ncbi:hypothetical protein B566_EDAN013178 [Ephemera danica]|nr:hypothetical protein B566_EDAN013178 [Ephemera danica]